jgi:hypothetical protein
VEANVTKDDPLLEGETMAASGCMLEKYEPGIVVYT